MKRKIAIVIMTVGLLGSTALTPVFAATAASQDCDVAKQAVQAAAQNCDKLKGVQIISGNSLEDIKAQLKAKGIECPDLNLPVQTPSENPDCENNEQPEVEQPEVEQPEAEQPETEQPETSQPENPGSAEENTDNSFASQVIALVNQERAKEGLSALTYDESIAKAALVRAKETETSFSHTRPNGTSFSTALTEAGVTYRGAGENIAYGQQTPEEVMNAWMNSAGHRANIMNKNFTKIGVGFYENNGVKYWDQLFTY